MRREIRIQSAINNKDVYLHSCFTAKLFLILVLTETPWPTAMMSTTADEETSSAESGATMTDPGRERTAAEMTGMTGERELHSSAEGTTFRQSIMPADSGEKKQRFLVHSE